MPRALWSGAISFGLVNIPVQLHAATREQRPRFHLLHARDHAAVHYQRVCERENKTVPWTEIVKGFEYEKGHYAVLEKEDFERAALEKSKTIDILSFVAGDQIDVRHFETPYYLLPGAGGERGYALLREAIRKAGRIGVAQIILREKQHLAALSPLGDALVLTMLRFADELVDTDSLSFPGGRQVPGKELDMAATLVESLAGPWQPERYHDQYRDNLMAIIKAKAKGGTPRLAMRGPGSRGAEVVDLMERLRESLGGAGQKRAPRAARGGARKKSTPRGHRRAA